MNDTHRPDPEFVGNLERELRSTIRRHRRFDHGLSARANVIPRLRWTTGLVALIAMCIGSAGTFAVTQRLRAQAADLIIAKAEAQLEFANARRDLFIEELQETESRAAAGVLAPEHLDYMRLELAQVATDAATRALDVEETRITGHEPDESLSAPIVRGRDFVTERLVLQQALLSKRVAMIDKQVPARALDLNESSMMAQAGEFAQAAVSMVEKRLALRQDFLSGARTGRQVELADMRFSVESQREIATRRVNELQPRLDRIHALVDEGMATRSEARPMEMEIRAAVLQRDLAELEMQILERKLADPSED